MEKGRDLSSISEKLSVAALDQAFSSPIYQFSSRNANNSKHYKDESTIIEPESSCRTNEPEQIGGDPTQLEIDGSGPTDGSINAPRFRPSEANGFFVYTRRNRFKSRSENATVASSNCEVEEGQTNVLLIGCPIGDKRKSSMEQLECENIEGLDSPLKKVGRAKRTKKSESTSDSSSVSRQLKSSSKITKKDHRMHKLIFEDGGLRDGTSVYYSQGEKMFYGHKLGSGIVCHCCNNKISPSLFEAHAGFASRRKPYMHIYTPEKVSLHEYSISLLKGRKSGKKDNDDLCAICTNGGQLVFCGRCPRAFHEECASLSSTPNGKWYCTYCQENFKKDRVSGTRNPKKVKLIACVLCKAYDFLKSGFGPRTSIICDQCEKEYHVGCLKEHKMADLKKKPEEEERWFCCVDCKSIHSTLHEFVNDGEQKIPDFSSDIIKKKTAKNSDVRWRLVNGKEDPSEQTQKLLSQAKAIFHDCFDPIIDSETSSDDFIPSLVYGRVINGQDYGGMYCAMLTIGSEVVSAAILRVLGKEIAELPLAATHKDYQDKGCFKALYGCIEKLLASLKVENFVLPATKEAESIWTAKFGFQKMPQKKFAEYSKVRWQMMTFNGTSMLEKTVPKIE